jgi:hypothetical protein
MAQDGGAGENVGKPRTPSSPPPFCLLQAAFVFRVGVFSLDLNGLFFNFSSVRVMAIIGDCEW